MTDNCNISASIVAEKRSYVLKIDGYSRNKGLLKNGKCMTSAPFSVGGQDWVVKYYPNGCRTDHSDFISICLVLDSADAKDMKAKFKFGLLDKDGVPTYTIGSSVCTFSSICSDRGYHDFIKKNDLEGSVYLRDDCVTVRCDVSVVRDIHSNQLVVNPSTDLHQHLGDLLENEDGADVTFQVGGERFSAHRCVLAARSPVFKAELFGPMKEKIDSPIEIVDMQGDVFKSLLHFIYTDSLTIPEMTYEDVAMWSHLLVAADRYNVEKLKLICEKKLWKHIDSNTVATYLALAEQHICHGLKEACFQFLSSPNFDDMRASAGYEHLINSCPSVLKELTARLLAAELKAVEDIAMEI